MKFIYYVFFSIIYMFNKNINYVNNTTINLLTVAWAILYFDFYFYLSHIIGHQLLGIYFFWYFSLFYMLCILLFNYFYFFKKNRWKNYIDKYESYKPSTFLYLLFITIYLSVFFAFYFFFKMKSMH